MLDTLTRSAVDRALWPGHKRVTYTPLAADELGALRDVAQQLWRGIAADDPRAAALAARAGVAGYELRRWRVGAREVWVLRERADRERGAGTYLFRVGAAATTPSALLQAPHAYFDQQTGPIAADVFFATDAPAALRGLFTNSLHRYQVRPGVRAKRKASPADVCHNPDHAFDHVTDAVLAAGARGVIQIHGFADRLAPGTPVPLDHAADDDEAGDDDLDPTSAMLAVVSAGGGRRPTAAAHALAAVLTNAFGDGVLSYPTQTKHLGATTNAQAARVDGVAGAQFVHVELSATLRDRLTGERSSARVLRHAVAAAIARLDPP